MSIYLGGAEPSAIYAGDTPVSAVYAGTTKLWPLAPPGPWAFDDFERSALGAAWIVDGDAPRIAAGSVLASTTANAAGVAYWSTELPGDDMAVGATVSTIFDPVQRSRLVLGATPNGFETPADLVYLDVWQNGWEIFTRIGNTFTSRRSGAWTLGVGDQLSLTRTGTQLRLGRNANEAFVTCPQPVTGPGHRFAGLHMRNYDTGVFGSTYYSPSFADWWAEPV